MTEALLVFHVRPARRKAMTAATQESVRLLDGLQPTLPRGGPLSELPGVFWVALPAAQLEEARERLPGLGYTYAVDEVRVEIGSKRPRRRVGKGDRTWRGKSFTLERLYEEDAEEVRDLAPDRRAFLIPTRDGVREVRGYRGTSERMSRRGLPVADARLLVNLAGGGGHGIRFLDPFAGAGGLVVEAVSRGWRTYSVDLDPVVRWGLRHQGAHHSVADARALPFAVAKFEAVATEPPFDDQSSATIVTALSELCRVLAPGGRLSMMVAITQANAVRLQAEKLDWSCELDIEIDRKGLPVVVFLWKNGEN